VKGVKATEGRGRVVEKKKEDEASIYKKESGGRVPM